MRTPIGFPKSLAIRETAEALLCKIEDRTVWVPKSLIDDDSEVYKTGDEGILVIPEWFCEEKKLI